MKKKIYIITGLFIAIIAIYIASTYFINNTDSNRLSVTVHTAPDDTKISVDGKDINGKKASVVSGKHTFTVSKEGFASYSRELYYDDTTDHNLYVGLLPESKEAKVWAEKNQDAYLSIEKKGGEQAQKQGEKFKELNPITSKLPYKNFFYTIGYRADSSDPSGNSIIIEIQTSEGMRENALSEIKRWGFNLGDLNIIFKNYENPFAL